MVDGGGRGGGVGGGRGGWGLRAKAGEETDQY